MTVYTIQSTDPDKVMRWDGVTQIDKLENGTLLLLCNPPNKDGLVDTILHDVISVEVWEN